jgi:hypothetical protein
MIVSHKYKFIFLKTKKTAGTSIEISLSRYCDEDDIITPLISYRQHYDQTQKKLIADYFEKEIELFGYRY